MLRIRTVLFEIVLAVIAATAFSVGWALSETSLLAGGGAAFCLLGLRLALGSGGPRPAKETKLQASSRPSMPEQAPVAKPKAKSLAAAGDAAALVEQMLDQGRYALLLRRQIYAGLSEDQKRRARATLEESMALTPVGAVCMGAPLAPTDGEEGPMQERFVQVESFFIDRFAVTNADYAKFVEAGGYEEMAIWDTEIWAGVLDFVDQTGHPGPRYWSNGRFSPGAGKLPVVGVSWYEAAAYARWAGKRLPSDPEWVKAASWPVQVPGGAPRQRTFPWGNSMDNTRANLWGSSVGKLAPVDAFERGASVGGVGQLVGNVWEWTTADYGAWDLENRKLELPYPMKSIRGGAFDTYFDSQATCRFQSGESPLARKHNVGFRCVVGACDLVWNDTDESAPEAPAVDPINAALDSAETNRPTAEPEIVGAAP